MDEDVTLWLDMRENVQMILHQEGRGDHVGVFAGLKNMLPSTDTRGHVRRFGLPRLTRRARGL